MIGLMFSTWNQSSTSTDMTAGASFEEERLI